ncbi:hypothetical protein [Halodesulfovibrio spirochaetisodalis]|uniref:hypothetical protein n=1 Tax=Halodesulfovibrio spirochaetisodalis TaxID=1560234 RepID=UPI0038B2C24E
MGRNILACTAGEEMQGTRVCGTHWLTDASTCWFCMQTTAHEDNVNLPTCTESRT